MFNTCAGPTATSRRVLAHEGGNVAVILALAAPVLLGLVGAAVDYATWTARQAELQTASDSAALAATNELRLATPSLARIKAVVESIVNARVPAKPGDGPISVSVEFVRRRPAQEKATTSADADQKDQAPQGVRVTVSQRKNTLMSGILGSELAETEVSATAMLSGGTRVCVIGLEEAAPDAVRLGDSAKITAPDCSVYANSKSGSAVRSESRATVTSLLTCSAGGYKQTSSANFQPNKPMTNCPATPDPLKDRPAPPSKDCAPNSKPLVIENATRTLQPGTYCGGLVIGKAAKVTLATGTYVIKNGPLIVGLAGSASAPPPPQSDDDEGGGSIPTTGQGSTLKGSGVGFFFTGAVKPDPDGATRVMVLRKLSVVEMTAPTTGMMAGLLFHEDRTSPPDRRFEVLSDEARRLVGTIYVPRGVFHVAANQNVADRSEYLAVVAKRLELLQAPNLVLNTRYGDTDVPVPDGLGPNSGKPRLTE